METTTSDHPEYSGSCATGLNPEASYDRCIYFDHERVCGYEELLEIWQDAYDHFQAGQQSRLVVRVLLNASLGRHQLTTLPGAERIEIDLYPHSHQTFQYATFAVNRAPRELNEATYQSIQAEVRRRVERCNAASNTFEEDALHILSEYHHEGYYPTLNLTASELTELWRPFGWTQEAVSTLLSQGSQDIVMGIRNDAEELMGAVLYNDQSHAGIRHGESTEWAISPRNRKRGLIRPLLLSLHSYLLEQGIQNIWADLRAPDPTHILPHSLSPALRSGMRLHMPSDQHFLASNHVTIEGQPQSYNASADHHYGNIPHRQLRSFVKGWVDPTLFTDRVRNAAQTLLEG